MRNTHRHQVILSCEREEEGYEERKTRNPIGINQVPLRQNHMYDIKIASCVRFYVNLWTIEIVSHDHYGCQQDEQGSKERIFAGAPIRDEDLRGSSGQVTKSGNCSRLALLGCFPGK